MLNAGIRAGHVKFGPAFMPVRAYSGVNLKLTGSDYVGTAVVSGMKDANERGGTALGSFTVFNLAGQGLMGRTRCWACRR